MRDRLVGHIMTRLVGIGAVLIALGSASPAFAQAQHVRWDIVSINFAAGTVSSGGMASAKANDNSKITMTGTGTFVAPAGGGGTSGAATGGGSWDLFLPGGTTPSSSGTYQVTGLVRWQPASGTAPPLTDTIDDGTPSAGLAVLRVAYSDGSEGILVVSCHLVGTPDSVFEGITASKGFVDYWNREGPAPGVDANRTIFHIQ